MNLICNALRKLTGTYLSTIAHWDKLGCEGCTAKGIHTQKVHRRKGNRCVSVKGIGKGHE